MGERTYPVLAAVGAAAERRLGWTKALLWMSMSFPNCVAQARGGAAVEWAGAHIEVFDEFVRVHSAQIKDSETTGCYQ